MYTFFFSGFLYSAWLFWESSLCINSSVLLLLSIIIFLWIYYSLFIHLPVGGRLGISHFGAMNSVYKTLSECALSFLLGILTNGMLGSSGGVCFSIFQPRQELPTYSYKSSINSLWGGPSVNIQALFLDRSVCWTFSEIAKLSSQVVLPFYISASSVWEFQCSTSRQHLALSVSIILVILICI